MLLPPALGSSPHPPVSVYGTGTYGTIAAFPGTRLTRFATLLSAPRHASGPWPAPSPWPASCACTGTSIPGTRLPHASPHLLSICGAGNFPCCPSGTPLGLPLGPDSPRADKLHPGNLGYSAGGIPTPLSLLVPAFSLPLPPPPLAARLRQPGECPPTGCTFLCSPWASAACFSPGHFRRGASRPVGCYALFKCLAASGPTSWLSLRPHILPHLTRTLGP